MEQLGIQSQQTGEQQNLLARYGRTALAVGMSVLALAGAQKAEASTPKVLPAHHVGNLYTPLTPEFVNAEANQGPLDQARLQAIGTQMVNSIPGQQFDLKQRATGFSTTGATVAERFRCPSPRAARPGIKKVEIDEGNKASLTYCRSNKKVSISSVNFGNPLFQSAFAEFRSDPKRTTPYGLDSYNKDLFFGCDTPLSYDSNQRFKFSPKKGMRASFQALSTMEYCDKVAQYSTEATAQIKKGHSRRYKQLGNRALHLDGLKEVLVYGSSVFFPDKYARLSLKLPHTKVNCEAPGMKHAKVRLKLREGVKNMRTQQAKHTTVAVRSKHHTVYTRPKAICN